MRVRRILGVEPPAAAGVCGRPPPLGLFEVGVPRLELRRLPHRVELLADARAMRGGDDLLGDASAAGTGRRIILPAVLAQPGDRLRGFPRADDLLAPALVGVASGAADDRI